MKDYYEYELNYLVDDNITAAENREKYGQLLEERIFNFVIVVIELLKEVSYSPINKVIVNQLAKSVTSIGANYEESQGASSRKDFLMKVAIAHRESRETNYWLRVIHKAKINNNKGLSELTDESYQIRNILGSIVGKVRKSLKE